MALLLTSILFVSGCSPDLPSVSGRWPRINVSAPVDYTAEERAMLAEFAKRYPETAKKIIGRNNELADAIEAYNRHSAAQNYAFYTVLGHKPAELDSIMLKVLGYSESELKFAKENYKEQR